MSGRAFSIGVDTLLISLTPFAVVTATARFWLPITFNPIATVRKSPDTAQGAASKADAGTTGAANSGPTMPNAKVCSTSNGVKPLSASDRQLLTYEIRDKQGRNWAVLLKTPGDPTVEEAELWPHRDVVALKCR